MANPLMIDLCCGYGGWARGFLARGYDVIGFDVEALPYPGQLVIQDVRTLHGRQFRGARVICASPPCTEFSHHDLPWTRTKNPVPPDMSLVEACFRIAREAKVPLILENVRGAQKFLGRAPVSYGSRYLWGDGVPALSGPWPPPHKGWDHRGRNLPGPRDPRKRALIPFELARHCAWTHLDK